MIWFIADAHLVQSMYVHRPLIRGDALRALDSIVTEILSKTQEGEVIFCGDNFNMFRPSPGDVRDMSDNITRLTQAGISVYSIQGNHDLCRYSWMNICGAQDLGAMDVVEMSGRRVYGLDYTPGAKIIDELNRINGEIECDILVLHQAFKHLSPFDTYSLSVEDMPGSVLDAVVSGHVHIPDKRVNSSGVSIVSPGATHPRDISEPQGTYVQYGTDFMHIGTPVSRNIKKFVVEKSEDMEEVLEYMETLKYLENNSPDSWPLVRVRYSSELINIIGKLKKYTGRCHLFTEAVNKDVLKIEDIDITINSSTEDILKQCVDEGSLEYRTVLQLTERNKPEKVLEEIDQAFKKELDSIRKGL